MQRKIGETICMLMVFDEYFLFNQPIWNGMAVLWLSNFMHAFFSDNILTREEYYVSKERRMLAFCDSLEYIFESEEEKTSFKQCKESMPDILYNMLTFIITPKFKIAFDSIQIHPRNDRCEIDPIFVERLMKEQKELKHEMDKILELDNLL